MFDYVIGKSCVVGYEFVWLSCWIWRGSVYGLKVYSNCDVKCFMKIYLLDDDGQLWKELIGFIKFKVKMLNRFFDLFFNFGFCLKDKEMDEDFIKN